MGDEIGVLDRPLSIPAEARPWAIAQTGRLDQHKGDSEFWDGLFRQHVGGIFASIAPYLPADCRRLLDIGGGLCAADVLIARHYRGRDKPAIWLLDSVEGGPVVKSHSEPFNDVTATIAFLAANGERLAGFWTPLAARDMNDRDDCDWPKGRFDLVVSFQAWAFHFAPESYLRFVRNHATVGARIILDVRRERPDWRKTLDRTLSFVAVAQEGLKYQRLVYENR